MEYFGHRAAVELAAALVERDPDRPRGPVLAFVAPRGYGKTALLDELESLLRERTRVGRLDLATVGGGPGPTDPENTADPENTEDTGDAPAPPRAVRYLDLLVIDLSRDAGPVPALSFPRYLVGRTVMSEHFRSADPERARALVDGVLARRPIGPRRFVASGARDEAGGGPVDAALAAALRELGRRPARSTPVAWYGTAEAGGTPAAPGTRLTDLNRWAWSGDPVDAERVTDLLLGAFLADLRADRRRFPLERPRRHNVALLVDEADRDGGWEFLRAVAEHTRALGDGAVPVTVVATTQGPLLTARTDQTGPPRRLHGDGPAGPNGPPGRDSEWAAGRVAARIAGHVAAYDRSPRRPWFPVELPELAEDAEVEALAATALPRAEQRRTGRAVRLLTGGHPGGSALVLSALGPDPDVPLDPRALLGSSVDDVPLLLRLYECAVEPAERERLTAVLVVSAAARDLAEAARLPARLLPPGRLDELADSTAWRPRPGGERRLPPLLRAVLAERLRGALDPAEDRWREAHTALRDAAVPAGDSTGHLYHALTLDGPDEVGPRLLELRGTLDHESWLALLEDVSRAPRYTPDAPARGPERDPDQRWALGGDADARATASLLADLRRLRDPLWAGRRAPVCGRIVDALRTLLRGPERGAALEAARDRYRTLAEYWA